MKLTSIAGLFVMLVGLASSAALAAPPVTDWNGTYAYSESLGRDPGGAVPFIEHRLIVGPSSCRIVAEGFQTDTNIRCKAAPNGNKLEVRFASFADGRLENRYGNRQYAVDQPLFSIARGPGGLVTTWEAYKPDTATPSGVYFKKAAR